MKILVTGTAGFIGHALVKKLLARGDEIIGLDNINDYYDVNLKYGRLEDLGIDRNTVIASEISRHCEELSPSLRGTKQSTNPIDCRAALAVTEPSLRAKFPRHCERSAAI